MSLSNSDSESDIKSAHSKTASRRKRSSRNKRKSSSASAAATDKISNHKISKRRKVESTLNSCITDSNETATPRPATTTTANGLQSDCDLSVALDLCRTHSWFNAAEHLGSLLTVNGSANMLNAYKDLLLAITTPVPTNNVTSDTTSTQGPDIVREPALLKVGPMPCIVPRGKCTLDLCMTSFTISNTSSELVIPFSNVEFVAVIPQSNNTSQAVLIGLLEAGKLGKNRVGVAVFQVPDKTSLKLSGELVEQVNEFKWMTDDEVCAGVKLYNTIRYFASRSSTESKRQILFDNANDNPVFRAVSGSLFAMCNVKTSSGYLYPLRIGLLFVQSSKTFIVLARQIDTMAVTNGGRFGRFASMTVTKLDGSSIVFESIGRDDVAGFTGYAAIVRKQRDEQEESSDSDETAAEEEEDEEEDDEEDEEEDEEKGTSSVIVCDAETSVLDINSEYDSDDDDDYDVGDGSSDGDTDDEEDVDKVVGHEIERHADDRTRLEEDSEEDEDEDEDEDEEDSEEETDVPFAAPANNDANEDDGDSDSEEEDEDSEEENDATDTTNGDNDGEDDDTDGDTGPEDDDADTDTDDDDDNDDDDDSDDDDDDDDIGAFAMAEY
jgi:Histone chaperone Rttp106-like, middle domain